MTMSSLYLLPTALRASVSLFLLCLVIPASSSPIVTLAAATPTSPEVVFTPPDCLQGRAVPDPTQLPATCDHTWYVPSPTPVPHYKLLTVMSQWRFTVIDTDNRIAHVSRSPASRAVLHFTGKSDLSSSLPVLILSARCCRLVALHARHSPSRYSGHFSGHTACRTGTAIAR